MNYHQNMNQEGNAFVAGRHQTGTPTNNPPAQKFRAGGVTATIWKNQGTTGAYYSVNLERAYQDPNGEWKHTSALRVNDVAKARLVLSQAFAWMVQEGAL